MNPYTYIISLGIKHPTSSLKAEYEMLRTVSDVLMGRLKSAGEPRTDPKGRPLEGTYRESHFGLGFTETWQSSETEILEQSLNNFLDRIAPFKELLQKISAGGGKINFFIGIKTGANSGLVFNPVLLKRIAELNIELGLDIYSPTIAKETPTITS